MGKRAMKPLFGYLTVLALLIPMVVSARARVRDLGPARMVVETRSAFEQGDTMAFRFAGRVPVKSPEPNRLVAEGDLTSLATGEKVGIFTWDLTCAQVVGFPVGVFEVTNTFRLPGGTLVSRGMGSLGPDPTGPGFNHVGIHPSRIIEATGVYAGRTGKAHMSGRHGGQALPAFVDFDDFWLIELDRKA